MSIIFDGKLSAEKIRAEIKGQVTALSNENKRINFVAVFVGDNPASKIYIEKKQKACMEVGINMSVVSLPKNVKQAKLNKELDKLSKDTEVHAILLQLPLPEGLDAREAISHIAKRKDVDGLTDENVGCLTTGDLKLAPCTAVGVMHILKENNIKITGAEAVVIGRSNIVGKPLAALLLDENATVTICHSKTDNLKKHTLRADIIIAAAGVPGIVKGSMVKKGAVVIDVGINRTETNKIRGDVDFDSVFKKSSLITPVPGGVGPLTIAFLLKNILTAYEMQRGDK